MVGIAGNESAQDCLVKATIKEDGGIKIELKSKLEKLFGKQMRLAAETAALELGQENVVLEIQEFGCLDFVIKARVKTAIKRAKGGAKHE